MEVWWCVHADRHLIRVTVLDRHRPSNLAHRQARLSLYGMTQPGWQLVARFLGLVMVGA